MSVTNDQSQLTPCPFCGGPPVDVVMNDAAGRSLRLADWVGHEREGLHLSAHVFCHECGAQGPSAQEPCAFPPDSGELRMRGMWLWNNRDGRHINLYRAGVARHELLAEHER